MDMEMLTESVLTALSRISGEAGDVDLVGSGRVQGLEVKEDNSMRGYWIGIMIDPETGELRGGGPREFSIAMGGRAVGY